MRKRRRDQSHERPADKLQQEATRPRTLASSGSTTGRSAPQQSGEGRRRRDKWRTAAKFSDPNRKSESYQSCENVDAAKLNFASTGWQGLNSRATETGMELVYQWRDYSILRHLIHFTRIPFEEFVLSCIIFLLAELFSQSFHRTPRRSWPEVATAHPP